MLVQIFQELEALTDPMRKEVSAIRKRVDAINRELKPLGQSCQRKVINECVFKRCPLILSFLKIPVLIVIFFHRRGNSKKHLKHTMKRTKRKLSLLAS